MSLTFYRAPMSTATVTELVLAELGVPHEPVTLDLQKGDTKKPEFLKLNPNGKVPTLVHDGFVVWESSAITMYLGETFGTEKQLYPGPGPKRGQAMAWLAWTHVTLGEAVYRFCRNTLNWTPEDEHNAKAAESGKRDVAECLRILDEALVGKSFLCGEFTIVDTHVNSFTDWLRHLKLDFTPYARLNAWSARCAARPSYKKVMGLS